ncbi:Hypp5814 [Branchiostoma lanceolatum]|uniref:Hypp5814 protein n=1 Tax=Branchiostoma lanceolatum TaxID=7740 RepID=A0A8J9VHB2_BRALA|nr:Hypp5814 [Branchiostoma lanceolatum]
MGDDSCGGGGGGGGFSDSGGGGFSGGGGGFSDSGGGFSGGGGGFSSGGGGFSDTGGGFSGGGGFSSCGDGGGFTSDSGGGFGGGFNNDSHHTSGGFGHGMHHGGHHGIGGHGFHSHTPHHVSAVGGGTSFYTGPTFGGQNPGAAAACPFMFAFFFLVSGFIMTVMGWSTGFGFSPILVIGPMFLCLGIVLCTVGCVCYRRRRQEAAGQTGQHTVQVVTSSGAPQPGPGGQTMMMHPTTVIGPGGPPQPYHGPSSAAGAVPNPTGPPQPYPGYPPTSKRPKLDPTPPTLQPCREGIHRRGSPPTPRQRPPHPRVTPLLASRRTPCRCPTTLGIPALRRRATPGNV